MTTFNPALSLNFAASEAARLAYAERGAEEVVANQLRQTAEQANKFTVGSTVTARYQYKVAEDGSFIPVQTQITTEAPREDRQGLLGGRRNPRQPLRQDGSERQPRFSDLASPKPQLSPSDELLVFAALGQGVANVPGVNLPPVLSANPTQISIAEVVDEGGAFVQAESITPASSRTEAAPVNFSARAQFSVAGLYARNNDIVYNVTPIARFAA